MKFILILLAETLLLTSCSTNSLYEEPTRVDYQLNKFGSIAVSNSPQFAVNLIVKEKGQTFVRTRSILKNLDSAKSLTVLLNKGSFQSQDLKWEMTCHTLHDNKSQNYILNPQQSILIECLAPMSKQPTNKDQFVKAILPVENQNSLEWSFVLKAEDLK